MRVNACLLRRLCMGLTQDEWMCIALLFDITTKFPNTIVKLHDTDGEVLLIEAANELPKWLEPETSDNRVYVAGGKLQVFSRLRGNASLRSALCSHLRP